MFGLCVTRSVSALDTTRYRKCFERYVHIISNPKYTDMCQAVLITQGRLVPSPSGEGTEKSGRAELQ